jgi:hypothetical protein
LISAHQNDLKYIKYIKFLLKKNEFLENAVYILSFWEMFNQQGNNFNCFKGLSYYPFNFKNIVSIVLLKENILNYTILSKKKLTITLVWKGKEKLFPSNKLRISLSIQIWTLEYDIVELWNMFLACGHFSFELAFLFDNV